MKQFVMPDGILEQAVTLETSAQPSAKHQYIAKLFDNKQLPQTLGDKSSNITHSLVAQVGLNDGHRTVVEIPISAKLVDDGDRFRHDIFVCEAKSILCCEEAVFSDTVLKSFHQNILQHAVATSTDLIL
jgi:hypothetical protein